MKYTENDHISSIEEVKAFASYLINDLDVNFHPDNDFADYICMGTGEPTFTDNEAVIGNRLMDECFEVCEKDGIDIYEYLFPILENRIFNNSYDK